MAATGSKTGQTTRADIEKKFREELGRDLTVEERRLLGWADTLIDAPTFPNKPDTKKLA